MTPTASQDPPIPQGGRGLMLWPWPWQGGWGGDPEPGTYIVCHASCLPLHLQYTVLISFQRCYLKRVVCVSTTTTGWTFNIDLRWCRDIIIYSPNRICRVVQGTLGWLIFYVSYNVGINIPDIPVPWILWVGKKTHDFSVGIFVFLAFKLSFNLFGKVWEVPYSPLSMTSKRRDRVKLGDVKMLYHPPKFNSLPPKKKWWLGTTWSDDPASGMGFLVTFQGQTRC